MAGKPAVVLLSGGLDSTTVLAIAHAEGYVPYALSFRYGQRHSVELDAARRVADALGVAEHVVADIDLRVFGGSALTGDIAVPHHERVEDLTDDIPVTYVPARNTIFLSFALAWAETLESSDVFIGVNALDYSGYPDCRPEYITRLRADGQPGHQGRRRGPAAAADPHAADRPDQGADHRARPGAGRRLLPDPQLLRPGCRGPGLRDLRLVPAAPPRVRRGRPGGPGARPGAGADGMTYRVKEIFYTLQGEGTHAGRPAVFCRFTSCNLWTGREKDRARAICQFCDTDFVGTDGPGGGRFATAAGAGLRRSLPRGTAQAHARARPFVVCTGGEPLLQLDEAAVEALHAAGFEVAVETNGTQDAPDGLDWVCVSPKAGAPLKLTSGDELKLVYPQEGATPEVFEDLDFPRLLLQPMDGPEREKNTRLAVEYCLAHPQWRLSLQTHKYLGIA